MTKKVSLYLTVVLLVAGSAWTQYPTNQRTPCYPACWDTCCINHDLDGDAEDFLIGPPGDPDPTNDWYAVGFYNPCGRARLTSVSFQFYDPGSINLYVFLGFESPGQPCPPCIPRDPGQPWLEDQLLTQVGVEPFIGNWEWEKRDLLENCIIIPAKRCFYVMWQINDVQTAKPRILGDYGHSESYSWFYHAEAEDPAGNVVGQWKCFPGYEYMVEVCLDYTPECVEINRPFGEPDITWRHTYRGEYPCICDDYTVDVAFHPMHDCVCEELAPGAPTGFWVRLVQFYEAPWGLFTLPAGWPTTEPLAGPVDYPVLCDEEERFPLSVNCEYHHHPDMLNWWARNIFITWWGKTWISTPVGGECVRDTMRYARRCRMTIWPDGPWDKEPVRWGLTPITIPVWNDHPVEMSYELHVEIPEELEAQGWRADLSETAFTLPPSQLIPPPIISMKDVYLSVWPDGPEPEGPVMIKVKAFKCTGEWGEVEIEFMPYPKHFYLWPDGRPVEPVHVENIRWSPRYPCENMPYDVWTTVVNDGPNSAYPKISFGLAPWGFYFPPFVDAVYDTVLWGGIGGFASQIVAPYHHKIPWFTYEDLECNYYQQYARNIVIDYPVIRRHCPDPDFPTWWTVEDSTTEYLRDCERWMWPKHRWVNGDTTWRPVIVPVPIHNDEPFPVLFWMWVESVPVAPSGEVWETSFDGGAQEIEVDGVLPGEVEEVNLSIIPKGDGPPTALPAHVVVGAAKWDYWGLGHQPCFYDTTFVDIKFMPFTGMCIRDTSGIRVGYKYAETCGGQDPTLLPGDQVGIGLMLDNEYPVSAAQIDLWYESAYMRVVDVQTTTRTAGFELVERELAPGTHEIALYSTPAHPVIIPNNTPPISHCELPPGYNDVGLLSIVTVTFEILPGAPAGACADIWYGTVILDGLPDWEG
ncbi:MAG: hypothetical protein JSV84_03625, partial [Gemmatimonadota bacterium]